VNTLPQVGDRMPERRVAPFTSADVIAYAHASGDANPLHLDPDLAQKVGLAAPPVHGMLLLATFEPALHEWRPDLRIERLSGRFTQPILIGEAITLSARVVRAEHEEKPRILVRLLANGATRAPAVVGEAILAPRETD
jgi:acyl dehydratase